MTHLLCQDQPDLLELETEILDARPGAVLVARSPFFPGGGGQLADRGTLAWQGGEAAVTGLAFDPRGLWHELDRPEEPAGAVLLRVDPAFRSLMSELHSLAHILNRLVYDAFGGALLTGAQLSADATFRVDFDLPGADNDRLRALDGAIADVIRQDLAIGAAWMPYAEARAIPGMFRSKAVAPPPQADGRVRIVEIAGLDRQACGGTHLTSTGRSRGARILKIENKGRHNRRVRVGLI
jgi:misacylated tRNA(Ala) deacylase